MILPLSTFFQPNQTHLVVFQRPVFDFKLYDKPVLTYSYNGKKWHRNSHGLAKKRLVAFERSGIDIVGTFHQCVAQLHVIESYSDRDKLRWVNVIACHDSVRVKKLSMVVLH